MKYKIIQSIFLMGILVAPIVFIFQESTILSIRYIAIIFSILSNLLSVFISYLILKFIYSVFVKFSREELNEIQCFFLVYLFSNSIFLLSIKGTSFFKLFSIINPCLIVFLFLISIIYHSKYKKNIVYPAIIFFILNIIFALIGVISNNV